MFNFIYNFIFGSNNNKTNNKTNNNGLNNKSDNVIVSNNIKIIHPQHNNAPEPEHGPIFPTCQEMFQPDDKKYFHD